MKQIILMTIVIFCSISAVKAQPFNKKTIDCDEGNAKSCYEAGNDYSSNAYKEKNYNSRKVAHKVALLYKRSCKLGYAEGCTLYAMSYASDREKDSNRDMQYYLQKGCKGGDEAACSMLKMMPQSDLLQKEK